MPRTPSRSDIECPGDNITYNCSIESNSETVHLIWHVTLPGQKQFNITYYNSSSSPYQVNDLNGFISTTLERYVNDKYIESILQLIVPFGIKINQTLLECSIGHFDNSSASVLVDSSGTLATVSLCTGKSLFCAYF